MFIAILVVYAIGLAIGLFISAVTFDINENFSLSQKVAISTFWPVGFLLLCGKGVQECWAMNSSSSGLSRKQRKRINYEEKMLEIERQRNDELQRNMHIIGGS